MRCHKSSASLEARAKRCSGASSHLSFRAALYRTQVEHPLAPPHVERAMTDYALRVDLK